MKKFVFSHKIIALMMLLFIVAGSNQLIGQGLLCEESEPFCTSNIYSFPAGTGGAPAQSGPAYGCLGTQPNPAWYHMRISVAGNLNILMYSTPSRDIDFICWGPFSDPYDPCVQQLTSNMIVDCSYSTAAQETCNIPNGQVDEYYILMITNFSNQPCNITFEKTSGTGETDCTIVPPPISTNSPLCVGENLHLNADTIPNATYFWSGPNGFSSTQQNPIVFNVTLEDAGEYQLIITVNGNSSDPVSTTVMVGALPDPEFDFNTACFGDTTYFTDMSTVDPPTSSITTWDWDFGDGNTASGQNQAYVYGDIGAYSVTLTTYTGLLQCPRSITKTVDVLSAAEVAAGEDQTIPNGWQTQLDATVTGGSGAYDLLWSPGNLLEDPTVVDPTTVALSSTVMFTLDVTDANSGCTSADSVSVIVTGGALSVAAAASPMVICQDEIVHLNAIPSGGSGNNVYSWTASPGSFTSDIKEPSDYPQQTTTYTVEVFDGQNTVTASVTVQVKPRPIANAGEDFSITTGTNTTLSGSASAGSGDFTYSWSPESQLVDHTVLNPQTQLLNENTEFTFTVSDANGCISVPDPMWVFVGGDGLNVNPTASPNVICQGAVTTLKANAFGGGGTYQYSWSDGASWTSTQANPEVDPWETTTYTVSVDDGFKIVSNSVEVLVNHTPVVQLRPNSIPPYSQDSIKVCVRDSVYLDAGDPINPPSMNYFWSNGATSRVYRATTNGNWIDFQTYNVEVTNPVTLCSGTDKLTIIFDFNECQIGIDENSPLHEFISINPNPTSDQAIVSVRGLEGTIEMTISDINGKRLYHWVDQVNAQEASETSVEVSNWPSGIYMISIHHVLGNYNTSLIKR